jgi:hypothetical protein
MGRQEDALAVVEESVTIRRTLAAARPDAFLPDLAGSLSNLSNRQCPAPRKLVHRGCRDRESW